MHERPHSSAHRHVISGPPASEASWAAESMSFQVTPTPTPESTPTPTPESTLALYGLTFAGKVSVVIFDGTRRERVGTPVSFRL